MPRTHEGHNHTPGASNGRDARTRMAIDIALLVGTDLKVREESRSRSSSDRSKVSLRREEGVPLRVCVRCTAIGRWLAGVRLVCMCVALVVQIESPIAAGCGDARLAPNTASAPPLTRVVE